MPPLNCIQRLEISISASFTNILLRDFHNAASVICLLFSCRSVMGFQ